MLLMRKEQSTTMLLAIEGVAFKFPVQARSMVWTMEIVTEMIVHVAQDI